MTTVNYVVTIFYGLLSITPRFKHKAPDGVTLSQFTVINTLGVPVGPIQESEVNVNCYANDIDKQKGIPDVSAMETMQTSVYNSLHNVSNAEYAIEFQRSMLFREEGTGRHYMNLRFRIMFLNN